MKKFIESEWDLISVPAQHWLDEKYDRDILRKVIDAHWVLGNAYD